MIVLTIYTKQQKNVKEGVLFWTYEYIGTWRAHYIQLVHWIQIFLPSLRNGSEHFFTHTNLIFCAPYSFVK